jgi:ferredoxin
MSRKADVRLRVDWVRCDGYGVCGDLLPELIGLDDWRFPIVPPGAVDRRHLHDVQRAADCCPVKALIVERVEAR